MKKIFLITAGALTLLIVALLISTNFIFVTEKITTKNPETINIFKKSVASLNNKSYVEDDEEFDEIVQKVSNVGKISIFDRLIAGADLDEKIDECKQNEYSSNVADLKKSKICVEIIYETKQDKIVYFNGKTKVINYDALLYVFSEDPGVSRVLVYYKSDKGYDSYTPLEMNGKTSDIINFIKSL